MLLALSETFHENGMHWGTEALTSGGVLYSYLILVGRDAQMLSSIDILSTRFLQCLPSAYLQIIRTLSFRLKMVTISRFKDNS